MLNKELLLAAGASTVEGHIKATVAEFSGSANYGISIDIEGTLSKVPKWYSKDGSELMGLSAIISDEKMATIIFNSDQEPPNLQVTVLEKGITVGFTKYFNFIWTLQSSNGVFTKADLGKTFNILFDPPPDSYD